MDVCSPLSWDDLFGRTSSFVTDGENMNIGAKNGLWALCDDYRNKSSSNLPPIKIWYAAHRISLAWKSVTKEVVELDRLIKDASLLSTYFHVSAVRTKSLQKVAKECNYQHLLYPRYFEVRWTQFCHELFVCILKNWRASIKYFQNESEEAKAKEEEEAKGHLNTWLDKDIIHLTSLVADVLYVYKRFHQAFQTTTS